MPLLSRIDENIKVGTTVGLTAGQSIFVFDGTSGKPDYRGYEIVLFEYGGRSPMIKGLDYSWDYSTGIFAFLQIDPNTSQPEVFQPAQWYTTQFQDPTVQPVPPSSSSLIDWSYFIRSITIPNIDPIKTINAVTFDRIVYFIQQYEPECLKGILGYALYKALINETSQRITDLIFGAEYTDSCGNLQYWRGLVQPTPKISLIANYIYYYYQDANATQTSGVNTNVPKGEASTAVSVGDKMLDAWNFFSKETKEMICFLWNKNQLASPVYPEFTDIQHCKTADFSHSNISPF